LGDLELLARHTPEAVVKIHESRHAPTSNQRPPGGSLSSRTVFSDDDRSVRISQDTTWNRRCIPRAQRRPHLKGDRFPLAILTRRQ
jgi:hypothetical protein